jgi:hypothetical protein
MFTSIYTTTDTLVSLSSRLSSFLLETLSGELYFGRVGSTEIAPLGFSTNTIGKLSRSFIDEQGVVRVVSVYKAPYDYTSFAFSTAAASEMGYVAYIPVDSFLQHIDISSEFTLVPAFTSKGQIRFYAYKNLFSSQLYNWQIKHGDGQAVIHAVSAGEYVDCYIISDFVPEKTGIVSATSVRVDIDTTSTLLWQSVSLVSSSSWLLSDIGKTLVINAGSFLITSLVNSTHATAEVAQYPIADVSIDSLDWRLYDFAAYKELAGNFDQDAVVSVDSVGLFGVSLGSFAATDDCKFAFLIFSGRQDFPFRNRSCIRFNRLCGHPYKLYKGTFNLC